MPAMLRRKLLWLIAGRAVVVTVLLGSAILILTRRPDAFAVDPLFFLIGLTYGLTALYSLALKYTERHRWLVDVQLGCDALIVSAVVLVTGGVTSYFSSLYTLPIIAASIIESRRGGMMVCVLGALCYGGLVVLQYFGAGLLPAALSLAPLPPLRLAVYTVGLNIFGFVAVAGLSGYLAEGLRRADEKLVHASNQLADLQAFSQHVIDSLTSGLTTTDIDGAVLTFNKAAEAITGVAASEAIGASVIDVLQLPHDVEGVFGAQAARPRLPRVEVAFRRGDGRQIELGLSTAALITPRGETGFVFTFQDVTESRRVEREARVQQRLAAVGEMAAGIAHEIRNPLASMSGSIQILRQELPLSTDQSQLMDIVLRESERLNDTIRSFLAFARPQPVSTARMDVRAAVSETARLLQNDAQLADTHEIVVDVPASEVWFDGDESQIRQIVWNLATNGLRAMPRGGRLRLAVAALAADAGGRAMVVITIQDEGTGIGPEELDGIFQPFRGSFARGTGLGLSIVQRIVTEYDGEIQVTSERGTGTTVAVRLPLKAAAPAPPAAAPQPVLGEMGS
jgi:two-component system sensor histidine kinase PilS (NtrC family)